jgi:8-oxo-dGTP diphosphatase
LSRGFWLLGEFLLNGNSFSWLHLNCRRESSNVGNTMKTKQIFEAYDRSENRPIDTLRFCPRCGAQCDLISSGRRSRLECPRCSFILYQNPSPGVVALIIDDGMVLLGERAKHVFLGGKWGLPGGFIELDEDFLSAAHREIAEETGLSIRIISVLSVVSNFLSPELHTLVIVLLAEKTGGTLRPGDDMVRLEWFPLSGPYPPMAFEADKDIIERYHRTRIAGIPVDRRFASL